MPWSASGADAAERVRELSPVLLARAAPAKAATAIDVHAKVHSLIEAATSIEAMCAMPSAFEAWI